MAKFRTASVMMQEWEETGWRMQTKAKTRADEREKVLDKAYTMLADELLWVLHTYGDDVYLQIADSIRATFGKILEGKENDQTKQNT